MKKNNKRLLALSASISVAIILIINLVHAFSDYNLSKIRLSDYYFHQGDAFNDENPLAEKLKIGVSDETQVHKELGSDKLNISRYRTIVIISLDQ